MTNTDSAMKWTDAHIEVSIPEEIDIDEICAPLEQMGWCIENAWIVEE